MATVPSMPKFHTAKSEDRHIVKVKRPPNNEYHFMKPDRHQHVVPTLKQLPASLGSTDAQTGDNIGKGTART